MNTLKFNPVKGLFVNPSKQLNTSSYRIFSDSLNLSQSVEAKYCENCTHVYEDTDLLKQDYNPLFTENPDSQAAADNFNESVNSQNYGKTA